MTQTAGAFQGRAVVTLPIDRIRFKRGKRGQPRKIFKKASLQKLARSIDRGGQKIPILVHEIKGDPNHDYEVDAGERRIRAKRIAGHPTIAAIVVNAEDDDEYYMISVIENVGRENLGPMEIAFALKNTREIQIRKFGKCTDQDLADICAKSDAWVIQHESLLRLRPEVIKMLDPTLPRKKRLTKGFAYHISRLPKDEQLKEANRVLTDRLTMNELRLNVREALKGDENAPMLFRGRQVNRFRSLKSLIEYFNREIGIFERIPREELEEAFEGRSTAEIGELRSAIEEAKRKIGFVSSVAVVAKPRVLARG